MHGAALQDLVDVTERRARLIEGVLCTDSRGGYDAVEVNESPLLGLSNLRSALQAFQLRDNLARVGCMLRCLASDYDLADALTKKRPDSRVGLMKYLSTWQWAIAFDPSFTAAKRNKQFGKSAIIQNIDEQLARQPRHQLSDDMSSHRQDDLSFLFVGSSHAHPCP